MNKDMLYKIGITLIPNIGSVNGKKLIAYCGGAEAVFKEKKSKLKKIPGIGEITVNSIVNQSVLKRAEEEIKFIEKHKIKALFYNDKEYPYRLAQCDDSPIVLYYKGNKSLNYHHVLAVVGTRRATTYGKIHCEKIIEDLTGKDVMIVSGLAYGIDSCAHRSALSHNISTIGVLGHGLDRIYPAENRNLAERMLENGGIVTEFLSQTIPDRENFPKRNRIIAGMSDAILVVESGRKGGAIITAEIAFSYSRDVFALPGKVDDEFSKGCNYLIKTNKAALVESGDDIAYILGWETKEPQVNPQPQLFVDLNEDEEKIIKIIQKEGEVGVDRLMIISKLQMSKIAAALLNLEFQGLVLSLPGKRYKLK
jgi:DNA processing protein